MDTLIPADYSAGTIVRIGRKRIVLDGKEVLLLHLLAEHKFLSTQQVAKFIHTSERLFKSTVRNVTIKLNKLHEMNLVSVQPGQSGGVNHGAEPHIWYLARLGHDVLEKLKRIETGASKKPYKLPSYAFASHRMAINDTKLILKHIAERNDHVKLGEVLIEENAWRYYTNRAGVATSLRPDMYAVTHRGHLKHHWFIEVDRDTEAPVRIIAKCNMYLDYLMSTDPDDLCCGEFPAVLWVVPTIKRRDSLKRHIAEQLPHVPENQLFIVVTPQELPALIAHGKLGELEELTYE